MFYCRFNWVFDKKNREYYALTPTEGYITPDTTVTFNVTFSPSVGHQCSYNAKVIFNNTR